MPAFKNHNAQYGVPNTLGPGRIDAFNDSYQPVFEERNYTIADITKDSAGEALGNCIVKLFRTEDDVLEQTTTSDGSGNYSFTVDKTKSYYCVAYKSGTPVFGTTANTLQGA